MTLTYAFLSSQVKMSVMKKVHLAACFSFKWVFYYYLIKTYVYNELATPKA